MLPQPELPKIEVTQKLKVAPQPDLNQEFLGGAS
jgi:hypothetical protein